MPIEQYGTTSVREIRFSHQDIESLLFENIKERCDKPYNFDYQRPILVWDDANRSVIFRFVEKDITSDSQVRNVRMKSFEEIKKK